MKFSFQQRSLNDLPEEEMQEDPESDEELNGNLNVDEMGPVGSHLEADAADDDDDDLIFKYYFYKPCA